MVRGIFYCCGCGFLSIINSNNFLKIIRGAKNIIFLNKFNIFAFAYQNY